jgi:effector-binding domain-containing protein
MKKILLSILALVILFILIGFFLPAKVELSRNITIQAPPAVVFKQINVLTEWGHWSPWHKIDTAMQITYSSPAEGTNAYYDWKSTHSDVGNGRLTILNASPNQIIDCQMDFEGFGSSYSNFLLEETKEGTQVTWSFDTDMGMNPIGRWMGLLMMKSAIGKDFEKGLADLKSYAESLPAWNVEVRPRPETQYIAINASRPEAEIGEALGTMYQSLMQFAETNKIEITNAPFSIVYAYSPEKMDFAACLPVNKPVKGKGDILTGTLSQGTNAEIDYYGPYEGTGAAHEVMDAWLKANGKQIAGPPYEVYVTDPGQEQDQSKWLTRICYPIEG